MSFRPDFELTGERTATGFVLAVRGELDSATADATAAECRRLLEQNEISELKLDLRNISFVDSAGMRMMILVEQLAGERGVRMTLVQPPEEVTALLRTAGVAQRLVLEAQPAAGATRPFIDRVELELPSEPMAASRARAEIRELMDDRVADSELGTLVLLTSELVTNAVVHAGAGGAATVGLRILTYEDGVRVEIEDSGEGFDPASPPRGRDVGSQGLFLVNACAAEWGAHRLQTAGGPRFCVWFELQLGRQPAPAGV